MKTSIVILAVVLFAAGCAGPSPVRPSPSPSASSSATTAPVPARTGTVHDDRTSFLVRITSVRTSRHFYVDGRLADDAPFDRELIIVKLAVLNTGHAAGYLEATGTHPLILVDTKGGTHGIERSWATDRDFAPGSGVIEPYVFNAPQGTKPAYVTVTLTDANGGRSVAALALPGRPSGGVLE